MTMIGRQSIIGARRRSLASLERDPLLPPAHHRQSSGRRASLAVFTSTHEEGEVSVVELFSDLVVVVALHKLSDALLEGGEMGLPMYCFQVLLLWCLWHNTIVLTNIANIYTANQLQVWHHIAIFTVMGSLVVLSKAIYPGAILGAFWVGRVALLTAVVMTGISKKPPWVDHVWHDNLVYLTTFILPLKALVESIPLLVSLGALHNDWLVLLGGIVSTAVGGILQIYAAYRHDVEEKEAIGSYKVLDVEHLKERHELIVLIFFGELCFAAASETGAYYISLCSFLTVIGCFLLYFYARVPEREEPWTRSALTNTLCQYLHVLLFGVVPLMSVGFGRLIEEEEENTTKDGRVALHFAAGGFICIMALIDLTAKDPLLPLKQPRWRRTYRFAWRFFVGCLSACLYWVPGKSGVLSATIVPLLLLIVAFVDMWSMQLVENKSQSEISYRRLAVGHLPDIEGSAHSLEVDDESLSDG